MYSICFRLCCIVGLVNALRSLHISTFETLMSTCTHFFLFPELFGLHLFCSLLPPFLPGFLSSTLLWKPVILLLLVKGFRRGRSHLRVCYTWLQSWLQSVKVIFLMRPSRLGSVQIKLGISTLYTLLSFSSFFDGKKHALCFVRVCESWVQWAGAGRSVINPDAGVL